VYRVDKIPALFHGAFMGKLRHQLSRQGHGGGRALVGSPAWRILNRGALRKGVLAAPSQAKTGLSRSGGGERAELLQPGLPPPARIPLPASAVALAVIDAVIGARRHRAN
jgi:hypothetical protein